jgi:V/A-type H+/Na+-transporting ATPase subunit D
MPVVRRIPPGRAGRMWLRGRLDTATRGRDQLDRKLRILIADQERLQARKQERQDGWTSDYAVAQTWLLRVTLLGGQDAVRNATPVEAADLQLSWTSTMGLTYPEGADLPDDPSRSVSGNSAIVPAVAAFRAALLAAAQLAAAQEALRLVEAEVAVTRRRLRALDKRWLPWLRDRLAALELTLDQAEQEDGIRLRRAIDSSRL